MLLSLTPINRYVKSYKTYTSLGNFLYQLLKHSPVHADFVPGFGCGFVKPVP